MLRFFAVEVEAKQKYGSLRGPVVNVVLAGVEARKTDVSRFQWVFMGIFARSVDLGTVSFDHGFNGLTPLVCIQIW
jgi:hypothetical protein